MKFSHILYSKLYKEIVQLQKTMVPTAASHKPSDVKHLRESSGRAIDLIRSRLPFKCSEKLEGDLSVAFKGIVATKSKIKPTLNVDDID